MKSRTINLLLSLAVIMVIFNTQVFADNCKIDIKKDDKSDSRIVLLAGGNAWSLFQTYIRELEVSGIKPSLRKVKVHTIIGETVKEFSLSWRDILTGQGAKERWEVLLKNINSDVNDNVLNSAISQKWDIVCIPKTPAPQTESNAKKEVVKEQKYASTPPPDAKLNLQQGMNYMRAKDWDNAINEFTLAIQKYPQYDTAYSNRAVAYMQQKKFNKAMDDLKEAEKINPKNPNTHYNFTCWYSLQNQLDRALDSLDKTLQYGFTEYDAFRNDPDLNNVRKHPEFRKILEKHKVFLKQVGS